MKGLKRFVMFILVLILLIGTVPVVSINIVKADQAYLNYSSFKMTAGMSVQLEVYGTTKTVKWSTSKKKIASVKKGKVTGLKKGKCTITAKVNGQKLKCKIVITGGEVVTEFTDPTIDVLDLKLDVHKITYTEQGASQLTDEPDTFKLKLLNKPKGKIVWSSSNEKVATVNKGNVEAVSAGKCTITAKVGKNKYKTKVQVTDYNDPTLIERQENIYLMLQLMNRDRVKAKSKPLKIKENLNKIADLRAKEVPELFAHTRPDGTDFSTAYDELGIKKGTIIGENVAFFNDKVEYMGVFVSQSYNALFNSEEHKANIINPKYSNVGLSYYNAGSEIGNYGFLHVNTYWVQEFYTE